MIPTTLPLWSVIVLIFGAIGLTEGIRYVGLWQLRRRDPRLGYAGALSLLGGLYGTFAALTYAQPTAEAARLWVVARFTIAAFFPWAFVATVEVLLDRRPGWIRPALLVAGGGLAVLSVLFPTAVVGHSYRVRDLVALQQTFFDFVPGPIPQVLFLLAGLSFVYVFTMLGQGVRRGRVSAVILVLMAGFGIMSTADILTIYGLTDLPYLLEFGYVFVITATNWSLLSDFFDTLREKEALEGLRNRLLTNISHELRTPLGVGMGYLELLERRQQGLNPMELDLIGRARSALIEEAELIDQLIELSRFAAQNQEPQRELVSLDHLVGRIFKHVGLIAQRKQVRLVADVPNDEHAWVDPTWFGLAIKNLVHNAIKFSHEGGVVTVVARRRLGELVVRVEDTGRGIPFAEQTKIFERFVQGASQQHGDTDTGLGIGLALVRDVVLAHKGTVRVFSREGEGAIFEVRLPGDGPPPEAAEARPD